jgi:hypothetical protein
MSLGSRRVSASPRRDRREWSWLPLRLDVKTVPDNPRYALYGLSLPKSVLKALQQRGIYCMPGISIEHQHLAKRYVLRGVGSGGGVADIGRSCAYLSQDGNPLRWLQSIDSIAVNGRHALFIAESLVRIEMLRTVRTYELAISLHTLSLSRGRTRPEVSSRLLFRGRDNVLPLDLWKEEHKALRGEVTPIFSKSRRRSDGTASALRGRDQENNGSCLLRRLPPYACRTTTDHRCHLKHNFAEMEP